MSDGLEAGRKAPRLHRITNLFLDSLAPRIRWLFWPFWFVSRIALGVSSAFWMLSNEYLKSRLGACGPGVRLHGRCRVSSPENLRLGDNVHINSNAFIRAEGGVVIGDNTHVARNLVVYSMNHNYQGRCLPYDHTVRLEPVHIGKNVWIGINVMIAPGSRIGDGAIIGMGAIVAGKVPPLAVVGMPAVRTLKTRDRQHYDQLERQGIYGGMSGYPLS